jgi:pyruvate carboxylase subunit B
LLGYFGKTPVPPDPKIVELASKDLGLPPTTRDPLEMNDENPKKGAAAARKKLEEAGLPITDENIFIAATCLEKGIAFLKGEATLNVRKVKKDEPKPAEAAAAPAPAPAAAPEPSGPARYRVTVNGHLYSVEVASETDVTVNGRAIAVGASAPSAAPAPVTSAAAAPAAEGEAVTAPLAGTVFKIRVAEGQDVAAAQTLIVLESMKMEIEVKSPRAGRVGAIAVREGKKSPRARRSDPAIIARAGFADR